MSKINVCFVSTYIPRQCGIATYTDNLMKAIVSADNAHELQLQVVAMNDKAGYEYSSEVKKQIDQNILTDYDRAADYINNSDIDVVSVQHEFGIYGGFNGRNLLRLLKKIKKPIVITLHTMPLKLDQPFKVNAKRHLSRSRLLRQIFEYTDGIAVMVEHSRDYLIKNFQVPSSKVFVIPHGADEVSAETLAKYRNEKLVGIEKNDFLIVTFGLISPKKGLEYVIKSLPEIVAKNPGKKIKYLIAGRMHPMKGPEYIENLKKLARKLGVSENIVFDTRYLSYEEIYRYLANADIYITPYYVKEQSSSGTLSYALSAGCCIVSTPYIFALEMVEKNKVGKLVEFRDSASISKAIDTLIKNSAQMAEMRDNSWRTGREIAWPKIGEKFINLLKSIAKK